MGVKWFGETRQNEKPVNEKLVARYVQTTNKVLNIASLDITTGIFTTSYPIEGSYSVGAIIPMVVNYPTTVPPKLFSEWNGANQYGLEYITPTTFYVVNQSSSNARVATYAANTVDLLQIVFEYNLASVSIDISGITFGKYIRTIFAGIRNRPSYSRVDLSGTYGVNNTPIANLGLSLLDGRHFMIGYQEQIYHYNPEGGLLIRFEGRSAKREWNGGTSWAYSASAGASRELDVYPNLKLNTATFQGLMTNGSVIEIYTTV